MGGFTGLAIFISCLGLWILVMFSCAVRTKEMGIRKVLGASRLNLFYQLGKDFFYSYPDCNCDSIARGVVQHECMVKPLCIPYRTESLVFLASGGVDSADFVFNCGGADHYSDLQ